MCVSLLERVKQGKSNIILILILSARSQDRDQQGSAKRLLLNYFNPLGRKTETLRRCTGCSSTGISIHSVARPRPLSGLPSGAFIGISIHSVARPRLTWLCYVLFSDLFQSTRSQDRDSKTKQLLIILSPFLYTFHT